MNQNLHNYIPYHLESVVHSLLSLAAMLATAAQPARLVKIGQRISERFLTRVNSTDSAAREVGVMLRAASRATEQLSNAFDWRVQQWLLTGSFLMNDR